MAKSKVTPKPFWQVSIRLDPETGARFDALIEKFSQQHLRITRTDVVRMCALAGLDALEAQKKPK